MNLNYKVELRRNCSKMKLLDPDLTSNFPEDVIYNLNCLTGYFNAIGEQGASRTIKCAEQMIKAAFGIKG